ncbi:caspase domain-containing protein [Mycena capillaripes]|nr:caspase domain-containing protein [Mycena capillaripes]
MKPDTRSTQLFAFIIGIDQYKSPSLVNLRGAVNDAHGFKDFLTQTLHVPESSIKLLTNGDATRADIIANFQTHLTKNRNIRAGGDIIIFFFAGHGSRVQAPPAFETSSGWVETMCPYDEGTTDTAGNYIHGIPDYTLHWLLQQLAATKGNNLTAVFDSCNSGGMGRKSDEPARFVETTVPIPEDLDRELLGSRAGKTSIRMGFRYPFMESHILLAACRDDEQAIEASFANVWKGRFTENLLTLLRGSLPEKTTYIDLIQSTKSWSNQHPLVEGRHKDRLLFDGRSPPRSHKAWPVTPTRIQGTFEVRVGSVEGVVEKTKFLVNGPDDKVICFLYAESVDLDRSLLVAKDGNPKIPSGSTATVSDWKNDDMIMNIFVHAPQHVDPVITQVLFPERHLDTHQLDIIPAPRRFVQVESPSNAHIELQVLAVEGPFIIKRLRGIIKDLAPEAESIEFQLNPDKIARLPTIVDAIAHFNYFLQRAERAMLADITLEIYTVKKVRPNTGDPWADYRAPSSDNLFRDGVAEVKMTEKYGFTIFNNSLHTLFPYLFYFDPAEYSIQTWYEPQTRASSLRSGGQLAIGHGNGGRGFEFDTGGKRVDTGFLAVFVSTEYLDMGWIQQISPIHEDFDSNRLYGKRYEESANVWSAFHAALTCRMW